MKKILFIPILFFSIGTFAQSSVDSLTILQKQIDQQKQEFSDSLQKLNKRFHTQKNEIFLIDQKISSFSQRLKNQNSRIDQQAEIIQILKDENILKDKSLDSIQAISQTNKNNIEIITNDLGKKIKETRNVARDGLAKLDNSLSKNRLYWIIVSLILLLLGGVVYWLLGKRISSSKTDVETQIHQAKKSLEEESIRLDNKLIEVFETQLKINQAEREISKESTFDEIDHSLPLKVASEIVRMQKNITRLSNKGTKGLKPLKKGVERIQANFAANDYEMINLIDTEYDDRMNIDVINFIEDDKIEEGKMIITRVIKPQVNYKGVLIQRGQVDVSQN